MIPLHLLPHELVFNHEQRGDELMYFTANEEELLIVQAAAAAVNAYYPYLISIAHEDEPDNYVLHVQPMNKITKQITQYFETRN